MNQLKHYGVSERFFAEASLYPHAKLARVIAQYRGGYRIVTQDGEWPAEISGRLRHTARDLCGYPVVGDCVMVSVQENQAIIHQILTRKSLFVRTAVGISGQVQPVTANVDTVFLCMSLNENFSLNRMERYLSIAWDSGATPVIVLTKADLCGDRSSAIAQVEKIACFCETHILSMYDQNLCEIFAPYFAKQQTCALIGSSGVGKSTLINRLLGGEQIATREIGKGGKGRHTTTGRALYPCPLGGVVMDTPGMREMGAESADLSKAFAEIEELAQHCRFRDCTHTHEPGCAVRNAIQSGSMDQRRLDSYQKLERESGYEGLSGREIEEKKCERMFRDVGGMKYARRFAKEQRRRK